MVMSMQLKDAPKILSPCINGIFPQKLVNYL